MGNLGIMVPTSMVLGILFCLLGFFVFVCFGTKGILEFTAILLSQLPECCNVTDMSHYCYSVLRIFYEKRRQNYRGLGSKLSWAQCSGFVPQRAHVAGTHPTHVTDNIHGPLFLDHCSGMTTWSGCYHIITITLNIYIKLSSVMAWIRVTCLSLALNY